LEVDIVISLTVGSQCCDEGIHRSPDDDGVRARDYEAALALVVVCLPDPQNCRV